MPIWGLTCCSFASGFIKEADSRVPRASSFLPKAASEDKCRQEERRCHKAWMKLDYFSLKYLSEPGEEESGDNSDGDWKEE